MHHRQLLIAARWALYALGGVLVLVLQQSVFARLPVLGAVPCLLPVAVALVAAREGPEPGGFFGLAMGLLWFLSGEQYGPMYIFLLPLSSLLTGTLRSSYLPQALLPSLITATLTLLLCEGSVLTLRAYLGMGQPLVFAVEVLYSLLFVFIFYPLVQCIGKLGGSQ